LQAAVAVSRDNALASFAALFPEQTDEREPAFDCSATEQALAAVGLHCPPADHALLGTYLDFMLARGYLGLPAPEEKCA